jgi:hypothetical protein
MPITAVVFDIGGVEDTPAAGVAERWEAALRLRPGELNEQLGGVWQADAIGAISEAEAPGSIARLLRLDDARLDAFMEDIWTEYLGTLNAELAGYLGGLRPRRRTALLSNSVVGARKRGAGTLRLRRHRRPHRLLARGRDVQARPRTRLPSPLPCQLTWNRLEQAIATSRPA